MTTTQQERAAKFREQWLAVNLKRLVTELPSQLEIELAVAFSASESERADQAEADIQKMERDIGLALEDYNAEKKRADEAERQLAELQAAAAPPPTPQVEELAKEIMWHIKLGGVERLKDFLRQHGYGAGKESEGKSKRGLRQENRYLKERIKKLEGNGRDDIGINSDNFGHANNPSAGEKEQAGREKINLPLKGGSGGHPAKGDSDLALSKSTQASDADNSKRLQAVDSEGSESSTVEAERQLAEVMKVAALIVKITDEYKTALDIAKSRIAVSEEVTMSQASGAIWLELRERGGTGE
jgi:hypothetical protein